MPQRERRQLPTRAADAREEFPVMNREAGHAAPFVDLPGCCLAGKPGLPSRRRVESLQRSPARGAIVTAYLSARDRASVKLAVVNQQRVDLGPVFTHAAELLPAFSAEVARYFRFRPGASTEVALMHRQRMSAPSTTRFANVTARHTSKTGFIGQRSNSLCSWHNRSYSAKFSDRPTAYSMPPFTAERWAASTTT